MTNLSKVGGTTAVGTWGYLLAMEELNEQLLGFAIFCLILIGGDVFANWPCWPGEMNLYRWDGGSGMSL